jgi:hypothetical protein
MLSAYTSESTIPASATLGEDDIGKWLTCSFCNKLFHKECIPHYHKMQMPEEKEDSYACFMFAVS